MKPRPKCPIRECNNHSTWFVVSETGVDIPIGCDKHVTVVGEHVHDPQGERLAPGVAEELKQKFMEKYK